MNQLELFEERAAIMEFDGGLPRKKAEAYAGRDAAKVFLAWIETAIPMPKAKRDQFEAAGWGTKKAIRFLFREQYPRMEE